MSGLNEPIQVNKDVGKAQCFFEGHNSSQRNLVEKDKDGGFVGQLLLSSHHVVFFFS